MWRVLIGLVVILSIVAVGEAERLRSRSGEVVDVPEGSVPFALEDGYQRIPKVRMRDSNGIVVDVDEDQVGAAIAQGLWRMTDREVADWEASELGRQSAAGVTELRQETRRDVVRGVIGFGAVIAVGLFVYLRFRRKPVG